MAKHLVKWAKPLRHRRETVGRHRAPFMFKAGDEVVRDGRTLSHGLTGKIFKVLPAVSAYEVHWSDKSISYECDTTLEERYGDKF